MPTHNQGYHAGLVVNKFQTQGGAVEFEPNLFLQKTKPTPTSATGGTGSPTMPGAVAAAIKADGAGDFAKSGAGTYSYYVSAVNRHGESLAVKCAADVVLTAGDLAKSVTVTITNSVGLVNRPDYFRVYRTEKNGTKAYCILEVAANSVEASGTTVVEDKNYRMPNTYTAFMGEFTQDVIQFKQLAPIMKMDLAVLGPAYRWMILLYGVPQLFAPRKWCKLMNIKADDMFGTMPNMQP